MKRFLLFLGAALMMAPGYFGQSTGNQIIVNQTQEGEQTAPVMAADQFGNHLVVWISTPQDNGLPGVYGRWFNPDGTTQSAEFQINNIWAPHDQPALAMGGLGSFVVVSENYWIEGPVSGAVTARVFNVNGQPLGDEFLVHEYTADFQGSPDVGMDGLGRFVIVWQSWGQDGDGFGVYGRLFDGNGTPLGPDFQINSTSAGHQTQPAVAVEDQGDFLVVWTSDGQDGDATGVYGQRFDRSGSVLGSEFRVNFTGQGRQERPAIAKDVFGNFMVCWQRYLLDEEGYAVYARIFDRTTQLKGPEFQVHEASPEWQAIPSVDCDHLGNFLITWQSGSEGESGFTIMARAFDGYGLPLGAASQVSTTGQGRQQVPQALMLSPTRYFVCWQSRPAGEGDWDIAHRTYMEAPASTQAPPRSTIKRHARIQKIIKHSPHGPAADTSGSGF